MKLLNNHTVFENDQGQQFGMGDEYVISFVIELEDRVILKMMVNPEADENNAVYCFSKPDARLIWQLENPVKLNRLFLGDESISAVRLYTKDENGKPYMVLFDAGLMSKLWYTKQKYTMVREEYFISNNQGLLAQSDTYIKADANDSLYEKLLYRGNTGPISYFPLREPFNPEIHKIICTTDAPYPNAFYVDIDTGKLTELQEGVD